MGYDDSSILHFQGINQVFPDFAIIEADVNLEVKVKVAVRISAMLLAQRTNRFHLPVPPNFLDLEFPNPHDTAS
ncbi:MAG: hypothetical protein IKP28_04760 [Clostridia bacterium]|nr:hypothetical protein [Clostridia bacterium]